MAEAVEVRKNTIKRYTWDDTAKVWENYIDTYQSRHMQSQWNIPPTILPIPTAIPPNLSDQEFTMWIFNKVMHDPDAIYRSEGANVNQSLKLGARIGSGSLELINRPKIFEQYKQRAEHRNTVEQIRVGMAKLPPEQFIIEAHQHPQTTI
jgi:hypothetical protein